MTEKIAPVRDLAEQKALHPLILVVAVLLAGAAAKLGHGIWGIGGALALHPCYLAVLSIGRRAAPLVARLRPSEPPLRRV